MCVLANIEPLVWESEFFAISTARLNDLNLTVGMGLSSSTLDAYQLVQAKVPADRTDLIDALGLIGFRLAEGEIALEIPVVDVIKNNKTASVVIPAKQSDIPALKLLARRSFQFSRFRTPWYKDDARRRFYELWVEKAVLGTFDRFCLLIKDEKNKIKGFITLGYLPAGEARIGLLAVDQEYVGQGIGTELINAAQCWCVQQKINKLNVATQMSNMAALKLYTRCHATVVATSYWLYR